MAHLMFPFLKTISCENNESHENPKIAKQCNGNEGEITVQDHVKGWQVQIPTAASKKSPLDFKGDIENVSSLAHFTETSSHLA